jgi:hypothetical protein
VSLFPSTVDAALAGKVIRNARLVRFDFASATVRLWQGHGDLLAGGKIWKGGGELGSISGLEIPIGDAAPVVTFSLSGVNQSLIAEALSTPSEYKDQPVAVYYHFFDQDWAPLDSPQAIFLGRMDVMKVKTTGPTKRTIELTAEGLFTQRGKAPWGYLSDSSQQGLFPGSRGLDQMAKMANFSAIWPNF